MRISVPSHIRRKGAKQEQEKDPMTRLLSGAACALVALAVGAGAAAQADEAPEIFTVITSPSPETQFMALILTTQAVEQGASARVLLCDEGGELGLSKTETPAFGPRSLTPGQLLRGLVERGMPVEVCAIFLPGREEGEADLIEGVAVAAPPDVAAHMIRPNVRYFTF
jgi:hypothetical protein